MNKDQYTIAEHHFKTADKLHTLYVQEWGDPNGKPTLYVHGGPGSGCKDKHKLIFDPKKYRVIFVDQRGSGHSTPSGNLENNTTDYLIEDFEMIRNKLKIDQWTLVGGSWGSTLSLCYAIKHPNAINCMAINGVWLATEEETRWLFGGGWKNNFPELWEFTLENTPKASYSDVAKHHLTHIQNKKSLFVLAVLSWSLLHLDEKKIPLNISDFNADDFKIEAHYHSSNCFIPENYILDNASKITAPIHIVQGRYDMVCPPINAYNLHKKLPSSSLTYTLGGHTGSRGTYDVLEQTLKLI